MRVPALVRRSRRGFVADDGAHRARTGFVAADARVRRSQPRAGRGPHGFWRGTSFPNIFGVVITYLALTMPAIILYESFLSYLGLGVQPPMASWGTLIAEGVSQINPIRIYWWLIVFPGGVLVATLLALNFLGDGLRDAWDVKGK